MTEKQLIRKADNLAADLRANGGMLNADQTTRFIKKLMSEPTIINVARTVTMKSDTLNINKVGIGERLLHAATPNTALGAGQRKKPTTSKVPLVCKEVIAEIRLDYETIEDNIEGEDFVTTVLDLVAQRAAVDLEELIIQGDTAVAGTDAYLGLFDGLVKRVTSNVMDATLDPLNSRMCRDVIKMLDPKYRQRRSALRWLLTPDDAEDLIHTISQRQTNLGDAALTGDAALRLAGIGGTPAAMLPEKTMFLTDPKNLIVGIRRRITLESERLISERQLKFVLTSRVAFNIEEEEAIVKVINIGNPVD